MNLNDLNDMQKEAVCHTEGPLLILAGAGSGKTRVLTYRIAYLVEEHGISPYHILAITFTNKAAREMKERIEGLLGDRFIDLWVSTFHSACVRILRMEIDKIGYYKNFVIYDPSDQQVIMKECLKKLDLDEKYFHPRGVLAAISRAKDQLIGPMEYMEMYGGDFRQEKIGKLYKLYQDKLRSNNALDFDDIIMKTVELFQQNPSVLRSYENKFQYIMVDEFQDTNMAQYTLVSLLAHNHQNLCVVGDDDQSIYGWRGADIQNILGFEKDFPLARVIKLERNYRSTKNILDAANYVVANNIGRKQKKLWTDHIEGDKIQYYCSTNEYDEGQYIVNTIEKLRKEEGRKYSDFAVLYRTNAQSRVIEEMFMREGIPYKVYGGIRFYDRKEIKDILSYLKIIENPMDDVSVKRVINVPKRGIGPKSIEKFERYAEEMEESFFSALLKAENIEDIPQRAKSQTEKFTQMIVGLAQRKDELTVTEIVKEIYEKTGYIDELRKEQTVEAMSRIENLQEFLSLTMEFDKNAETKTLEEFLARTSLETSADEMDEEENVVILMTLHSAKGLEFPVVFITGMEEGIFPSQMAMDEGNEEEERRLCYVGITRAMEKLYLSHSVMRTLHGRTNYNKISRFIEEIPEELIERKNPYERKKEVEKMKTSPLFMGNMIHSTASTKAEGKTEGIRGGSKVKHPKFGIGTVVSVAGDMITIAFPNAGIKKISTAFVKLEIVG